MVLFMTLVASYVLVSPHFYLLSPHVGPPTTIGLHDANVPEKVAAVEVLIVVDTVLKMKEETSLASTTNGVNTGIFKTNTTGLTVLAHAVQTLVTQTKNQPPMTNRQHQHLRHQAYTQHGATVHSSCSPPKYTIGPRPSIIHGCKNAVNAGRSQNLLMI